MLMESPSRGLEAPEVRMAMQRELGVNAEHFLMNKNGVRTLQWPVEHGWDLLLYGCSSLRETSRQQLMHELKATSKFLTRACGCCKHRAISTFSNIDLERRNDTRMLPLITIVDRGANDRRRTIPNIAEIEKQMLREFMGKALIQRINFAHLKPCEQWCVTHASTILIGQHGAGLANAALLRGDGRAALIEITPKSTAFKTIYPCVARLREVHFVRIHQNTTHSAVDTELLLSAVRSLIAKIGQACTDRWPPSLLSKRMKYRKCPSAPVQEIHYTNSLVRSGECRADGLSDTEPRGREPSPKSLCYIGDDTSSQSYYSRVIAEMRCSFPVATMATKHSIPELDLFFRTYSRFERDRPLFVAADFSVAAWFHAREYMHPDVHVYKYLDKYGNLSRSEMTQKPSSFPGLNLWTAFQLEKANIMETALRIGYLGVLFIDSDLFFVAPLPPMGLESLGVSPHRTNTHFNHKYGTYNGGLIFVRNITVLKLWRNLTVGSPYFEQWAIEPLAKQIPHFIIDPSLNLGWYQMGVHASSDRTDRVKWLQLSESGGLSFNNQHVQSIHAHIVPGTTPSYYPKTLVSHLTKLLNRSIIRNEFCAAIPSFCGQR